MHNGTNAIGEKELKLVMKQVNDMIEDTYKPPFSEHIHVIKDQLNKVL